MEASPLGVGAVFSVFSGGRPSVGVCVFMAPYKNTSHEGSGPHPVASFCRHPLCNHLSLDTVTFSVPGLWASTHGLGDTIQPKKGAPRGAPHFLSAPGFLA